MKQAQLILCAIVLSLSHSFVNTNMARGDDGTYQPVVGQPHPQVKLPRIDTRDAVSLSDFRGKKVLLIHFASW